jgi:protein-tyrosine-phosphatase
MAAAIYNHMTNSHDAISAGTYTGSPDEPEGRVLSDIMANDATQFKVLEENGMNIRSNKTKKLTPQMLDDADVVISMAEEPFIPDFLKNDKKVIWWDIENPKIATPEFVRETYERLGELIRKLIKR